MNPSTTAAPQEDPAQAAEPGTPDDGDDLVGVATFNFELNGRGKPALRQAAYELLAGRGIHLLFRQEMPGADQAQHAVMYEMEEALGPTMRGWLGERSCTAVFADTRVFRPLGHWDNPWDGFKLPPTAVTLQLRDAGEDSTPIIATSAHLNYASALLREIEAGWWSTFNDKRLTLPSGRCCHAVMIGGVDRNSYPHRIHNGPPLPELGKIPDHPHRAHRSRLHPDGTRVMDQVPDDLLHTAGLLDITAHLSTRDGHRREPTMLAYPTHGPDAAVDALYASRHLLAHPDLVASVEVIDAQEISDHQIVIAHLRRSALAAALAGLDITAA
ncbi:hypothetical protein [Actinacidiphila guanduensis]|uniref:Uncharacterized protein n=1 Tax=Actinacidiphila guanduensis TaxID=310781 RepID=A0A1G9Z6N6_9ACTN|nr:hypothetical protein [Actinacidiphila guanduensis]SDN16817.1 hypothetical protein SAMN05216259_10327 [Actinacidiphila guanduensis]